MKNIDLRDLKNVNKTLEEMMNDPETTLKDATPAGISSGLPSVSVGTIENPKDVGAFKFLTDAEIKESNKTPGKFYAWAEVEVLYPHVGYDSAEGKEVDLKKGEHARINLIRHANLRRWFEDNKPLKGRAFIIGTLGRVKTKKGAAFDYRIKEITDEVTV